MPWTRATKRKILSYKMSFNHTFPTLSHYVQFINDVVGWFAGGPEQSGEAVTLSYYLTRTSQSPTEIRFEHNVTANVPHKGEFMSYAIPHTEQGGYVDKEDELDEVKSSMQEEISMTLRKYNLETDKDISEGFPVQLHPVRGTALPRSSRHIMYHSQALSLLRIIGGSERDLVRWRENNGYTHFNAANDVYMVNTYQNPKGLLQFFDCQRGFRAPRPVILATIHNLDRLQ
jgi:hypothetical protein